MQLTTKVPECRMPAGNVLPDRYYKLAKTKKEFNWVLKAMPSDHFVNGEGWERIDGSSMFDWFSFYRVDLNNDGYCDWYVNTSTPISAAGDRDSINTIYLGSSKGWMRIGATVPNDKPDGLGRGKSYQEQNRYLFGEDIAIIHDVVSNINYFVTAFYNRHDQYHMRPGYRIFDWDSDKKMLRLLDKWQPGSKAAKVYAFFKTYGAWLPKNETKMSNDSIQQFDPSIEALELMLACNIKSPHLYGALSPYMLARCQH